MDHVHATIYSDSMLIQRAYRFRLEPTPEQGGFLAQTAGACRALYNIALEQRQQWRRGRVITLKTQSKELTQLRAEVDWMKAAPVHALQSALKDLDRAFENFFAGRAGYPRFKKKGDGDGFHLKDKSYLGFKRLNRRKGAVKLPKVGWVKLRGYRPLGGELRNVTISRQAGHWYVSVQWQAEIATPKQCESAIGLDRGIHVFAALSNGQQHVSPQFFRRNEKRLSNAQRKLARQERFSSNWKKTRARISRLQAGAANARRDCLHKISMDLAKNHGMVAIEALRVKNMSRSAGGTKEAPGANVRQKSGLNRAILDKGWSSFATMPRYKLEQYGGELIEVPPKHTSQTCAECGTVNQSSRQSRAEFVCVACGHADNADVNAAKNILRLGPSRWACGSNHTGGRKQELSQEQLHAAA